MPSFKLENYSSHTAEFLRLAEEYRSDQRIEESGVIAYEDVDGDGIEDAVIITSTDDFYDFLIYPGIGFEATCSEYEHVDTFSICRPERLQTGGPYVSYSLDRELDNMAALKMVYRTRDPAGVAYRARAMGMDGDTFERLQSAPDIRSAMEMMDKFFKKGYEYLGIEAADAVCSRQKRWNEINDEFFSYVEERTGTSWAHSTYKIILSPYNPGISSNGGNVLHRTIKGPEHSRMRIDAHEVLLAHFYQYLGDCYDLSFEQTWALGEIATVILLDEMADLFPEYRSKCPSDLYFACSNYPQLPEHEMAIRYLYDTSNNYGAFLDSAVEYISGIQFNF